MRVKKIPKIEYNTFDSSIQIFYNKPSYSLIWLHGLGDTSDGFQSFFAHSLSPVYEGARIKLIQAPLRSIAINEG
jgi:phospholipase/carboxylesterase